MCRAVERIATEDATSNASGEIERGAPLFEKVPTENAVNSPSKHFTGFSEIDDPSRASENRNLPFAQRNRHSAPLLTEWIGSISCQRLGSMPKVFVEFFFFCDRPGHNGPIAAGVNKHRKRSEPLVGERYEEVFKAIVERK